MYELSSAEFILRLEGLRNWNSGIMGELVLLQLTQDKFTQ
jgi:hypothetical protein